MEFDFKFTSHFSLNLHYHCIASCYIKLCNSVKVCLNMKGTPNLKWDGFEVENIFSVSI